MKFPKPTCPHCTREIFLKELPHHGLFDGFRTCPGCGGRFTVDSGTKYRQAAFIIIALISLAYTLLLYFHGLNWLIPALVSYVVLGILIYRGNRKVFLVPYEKNAK